MVERLIEEAFNKAGEAGKESVNAKAEYLSEYILQEYKYSISSKSLTRYYKGASTPNQQVKDYLSGFLGHDKYEDFILANRPPSSPDKKETIPQPKKPANIPKKRILVTLLLLPLIAVAAYMGYVSGEEKCIKWDEDHYIETACSGGLLEQEYNDLLLNDFRKIEVTDTTTFFKYGRPQIWYDKSNNQLEFFTAPGIHPVNGKTLKPITDYIIEKYNTN